MILALTLTLGLLGPLPQPTSGDAVRDAESRRVRALIEADYRALDLLLADDMTYTHSTAKVDTKTSYLEPLRSGRTRYQALDASDVTVRVYGDTGVVTGVMRSTALVAGRESRTAMRFTNVWVVRDGRWQMVAWQSTRLPDEYRRSQAVSSKALLGELASWKLEVVRRSVIHALARLEDPRKPLAGRVSRSR